MTGKQDWGTPPKLYQRLNEWFAFTYDAFAGHENALCEDYSTENGTYRKRRMSPNDLPGYEQLSMLDGLQNDWVGRRVFMNPPYSAHKGEHTACLTCCMAKAYSERENADIIVALIPFDPSTRWWQNYVEGHCFVVPLPKRVKFVGAPSAAPFPSAVVIYKKTLV